MKQFQFRLEVVLQYRKQVEELALADFQNAMAQERLAEDELKRMAGSLLEVCRLGINGDDGPFRQSRDEFKWQLSALIKRQTAVLKGFQQATLEKRSRYLETKKDSKILERLREKAWIAYQKSADRQEQRDMDDLFLMKVKENEEVGRMT